MEIVIGMLIVIILLSIFGFYSRKKVYREVDRLETEKIEIMNRPIADEIAKVKSLNMTGQTEKLFERWRREWDEIITVHLPEVEELLYDAEEYADKYRFKKAKGIIERIEAIIMDTENTIATILSEVKELIGSEESNRIEIEELQTAYRNLKKKLLAHRYTFGKAEAILEKYVEELSLSFKEFQEKTSNGDYLEARELLFKVKEEQQRLTEVMEEIPQLLVECQSTIPNEVDEIEEGYKSMFEQGYLLDHLQIEKQLTSIRLGLESCISLIEAADIENAKNRIDEIKELIEALYELLEKEVEANQFVHSEIASIEQGLQQLLAESKKTEEDTIFVQKSYQLSEQDIETHAMIMKQLKLVLKQFITVKNNLNENHVAYTIVQEQLQQIYAEISTLKEEHIQYYEMIQALRKDELHAKETIAAMNKTLVEAKRIIMKSNIPGLPKKYTDLLVAAKQSLEQVAVKLEEKPLNMVTVNESLQEALELVERTYSESEKMVENVHLIETVIQYGNRYRSRNRQLSAGLQQAELSFRKFDYDLALEQAASAVEEVEPGALNKIQKILETI